MPSRIESTVVERVARSVRRLRKQRGMTVQQLADAADVSRRMLTQIELGQANPSLATLDKIAGALSADFASLITDSARDVLSVVRESSATPVWTSTAGSHATLHTSALERGGVELWTWTLAPHDRYEAMPDSPGSEEHFYVVSGQLTIETNDAGTAALHADDAARLASEREYAYRNDTDEVCVFVRATRVNVT